MDSTGPLALGHLDLTAWHWQGLIANPMAKLLENRPWLDTTGLKKRRDTLSTD